MSVGSKAGAPRGVVKGNGTIELVANRASCEIFSDDSGSVTNRTEGGISRFGFLGEGFEGKGLI